MADKFSVEDIIEEYSGKLKDKHDENTDEQQPEETDVKEADSAETIEEQQTEQTAKEKEEPEPEPEPEQEATEQSEPVRELGAAEPETQEMADIKFSNEEAHELSEGLAEAMSADDAEETEESEPVIEHSTEEELEEGLDIVEAEMEIRREEGTLTDNGNVPPVNRATINDIEMHLTGKIIPDTAPIDLDEQSDADSDDEQKMLEKIEKIESVEESRREKVEGFSLENDEEEEQEPPASFEEDDDDDDENEVDIEYLSFEDTSRIRQYITALKDNLNLRMIITTVCCAVSLFITMANDFGWSLVQIFDKKLSPSAFLFTNTLMGLIAIFVGYTVVTSGIRNLINKKPDCDSIAAVGLLVPTLLGIGTLFAPDIARENYFNVYICTGITGVVFNTLGKIIIAKRTEENFRFVSGDFEKYAVDLISSGGTAQKLAPGLDDPMPKVIAARQTDFVEGFMKNSYSTDIADKTARSISPLILAFSVLVGIAVFFLDKNASGGANKALMALSAFSGAICICSSLSFMLAVNLPLLRASQKATKNSAVILGYSSAEKLADTQCIVTDATRLFPRGSVDLVNLKITSRTSIEECILMAASISFAAGSVLQPTFFRMLKGKTEMLYPVESYMIEDEQGISGWIENKRVLLGTRELMENHSIEGMPTLAKEMEYAGDNIVLYLSISGIVSTLFVVKAAVNEEIRRSLEQLEYENIKISVKAVDGFINTEFISSLFGIDRSMIRMIPFRYHKDYEERTGYREKAEAGCLSSGQFTASALIAIMSRNLKSAAHNGMIFQYATLIVGALLTVGMLLFGSISELSATIVFIYQIVMMLASVAYQHFKSI
ncbi:MAG: hypothetical protein IJ740_16835 [Ruminococcus sp.]|nr:hypothetical protein [Ruminococcus sp.]